LSVDGVERLRAKRGHEQVTFDDVADHFEDFVQRRPEARATIEAFAAFLARVEDVDHEHEGHGPTLDAN
jgi:Family of unknown function (DUF6104)